jgi:hypothetical protein
MEYITPSVSAEFRNTPPATSILISRLCTAPFFSHDLKHVATENLTFNLVDCPSFFLCRFKFMYGSNLETCPSAQMSLETGFYMLKHIHIGTSKSCVARIFHWHNLDEVDSLYTTTASILTLCNR